MDFVAHHHAEGGRALVLNTPTLGSGYGRFCMRKFLRLAWIKRRGDAGKICVSPDVH